MLLKINSITRLTCLFFCFIKTFSTYSQEEVKSYTSEISVSTDNDIFVFYRDTDSYYSYGIAIGYSFKKEKFLGLEKLFRNKKDVFYKVNARIEGYTPSDVDIFAETLEIEDRDDFDRPFAGLLYGTFSANYLFERSFLKTELLLGIMGPSSQAGDLQSWFHGNVTGDPVFDGWQFQLANRFLANLNINYVYDFKPNNTWFDVYGKTDIRLGSLYVQGAPSIGVLLGKFNSISTSSGFDNGIAAKKNRNELFFKIETESRFNLFNSTIQGNIFDDSIFSFRDLNNLSWHYLIGLFYSRNRFSANFSFQYSTGVLNATQNHAFGIIGLAYGL